MTNPGLPREEAERTIAAVVGALKEGYDRAGAITRASHILKMPRSTVKSRLEPRGGCSVLGLYLPGEEPPKAPDYAGYFEAVKDRQPLPSPELPPAIPATELERRNIRLEDENRDLKKRLAENLRQTNADEMIRQILGGIVAKPVNAPDWLSSGEPSDTHGEEVPVMIWSDWHASEVVSRAETNGVNEFNHDILERRVRRLVERAIDLCKNHGPGSYPGIVINLLGDFVSGSLHPELLATDEEEVIPTCLRVRDLLVWAIGAMADAFGNVYLPCTSGNHGRSTHKPEFKRYVFKNFDWLIYQLLARHFDGDERVIFDIPEANEVHYKVYGQRYLAMHGDMLGTSGGDGIIGVIGPIMRGDAKVGRQSASVGLHYDVLLIGHWHQQLWLSRIICANSLKGFDEYAKLKLRATPSTPSQPLWFVHPKWGRTAHRDVLLEDPGYEQSAAWVSFRQAAA